MALHLVPGGIVSNQKKVVQTGRHPRKPPDIRLGAVLRALSFGLITGPQPTSHYLCPSAIGERFTDHRFSLLVFRQPVSALQPRQLRSYIG